MMKRILSKLEVVQGARLPWWQGVAYLKLNCAAMVCLPIPLNLIVRWSRDTYFWFKATQNLGWFDKQLSAAYNEGFQRGQEVSSKELDDRLNYIETTINKWVSS